MDVDSPCAPPYPSVFVAGGGLRQGHIQIDCDIRPLAWRGKCSYRCGQQELPVTQQERPRVEKRVETSPSKELATFLLLNNLAPV